MENKTTKRDALALIKDGISNEITIAYALAELEALDKTNAKRRAKNAEKRAEEAPIYDAVAAVLTDEPKTASDVFALGIEGIPNVQKASSVLRNLVDAERANVQDVKVKGKGTAKGYTAVTDAE